MSDGRGGRGNAATGSELTVPSQDRAIDALPPLQAAWVRAKVERGCSNTEAARLAGYDATPDSLKTIGYRLSHEKRVRLALFEECQLALHTSSAVAVRVLEEMAGNPEVEAKDRIRASVEILNRSGLHAMSEHKVTVDSPRSRKEIVASIINLCAKSGLDAAKMLGVDKAAVTDAEFVEVTPKFDPEEFAV